jgi:UDP-N-acetylglucosamine/UDP-N-acetylgalactosamine 4-epimerase
MAGSIMSNSHYATLLNGVTRTWLVTGVAGFIGSNLLEVLLRHGQRVVGLDNFATGHRANLQAVKALVGDAEWQNFTMIEGDITEMKDCARAMRGVEVVLHQAALGSVPRSIVEPLLSHQSNVNGFLNILLAARDAGVKRVVYAASSATYGDHPVLPKIENEIGKPLSPYAVTKHVNELYAYTFAMHYGLEPVGLRYFNVFGPRQDPEGAYAAVIPTWFKSLVLGEEVFINGDGETSRDFCYIDNVVQANIRAGLTTNPEALNEVYNIAVGESNTLNALFDAIRAEVAKRNPNRSNAAPTYREFRAGDVRHSLADISKAQRLLGYSPTARLADGLAIAADYYAAAV